MRFKVLSMVLAVAAALAGPARAQTIKPLDVARDENGVDYLSGQIATPLPVLSIPAAPNLRFQRVQDLLPFLSGQIVPNTPGNERYDINAGQDSSEHFDCAGDSGNCTSKKRNGAHLVAISGSREFTYYEGGGGREIFFDLQNGPQAPINAANPYFSFHASTIRFPSGETLTFSYDAVTDGNGQVWRRPTFVESNVGYTLALTYQGGTHGQPGWPEVASATIHAGGPGNLGPPLARLSYSGGTVTDLGGRTWTCTACANSLAGTSTTTVTTLRLPAEGADTLASEAQPRTYGPVTHSNWVTRVTRDGVQWNYSYQAHPSQPQTRITQVNIAGPDGFARTANVHNGPNVRPRIDSITDSLNRTTFYLHDSHNRVTRITYPEQNWAGVSYDILGNITERRQGARPGTGLADLVETAYFPLAAPGCHQPGCFRPAWTRDALGRQTDYSWDPLTGDLLTRLEPADPGSGPGQAGQRRKTINTWDGGRLVRERICLTDAAGVELTCGTAAEQVRAIAYWGATPLPASETLTDGAGTQALVTTHSYDPAGRLLSSDGPLPGTDDTSYYRYDLYGRRIREIGPRAPDGLRLATVITYRDSDDKVLARENGTVTDPDGALTPLSRVDIAYDARRNPERETVSAGGTAYSLVQRSFDLRNRLECETWRMNPAAFASPPASACTLGPQGDQGPDRIARTIWDAAGQRLQLREGVGTPDEAAEATWAYDASGQITTVIDGNGNRATLAYDGHGRQDRWTFPSTIRPSAYNDATQATALATAGAINPADYEAYGYDLAGNRTSLRKRDGSVLTYQYDALNRMIRKTVPERAGLDPIHTRDVHFGYDVGNRQIFARFDSPSGEGVTSTYDSLGRLASTGIDMGGTPRTLLYRYDPGGRRDRITHPDETWFAYTYDARGRPTFLSNAQGWLVNATYTPAGLPQVIARSNATWSGHYWDPIQRLAAYDLQPIPSAHGVSWSFGRNPAGQIVTLARDNDAYAWTGHYAVSRDYTADGLNRYTAAGAATFGYDPNGNLTSDGSRTYGYDVENRLVTASPGGVLRYDPLGRLWQVSGASGTTRFLYDGDALVAEYDGNGAMQRRYAHWVGADVPVVEYVGAGISSPRHLFPDHQGSIVAATGIGAALLYRNAYDEYGIPAATNQGRFQYTGQAWLPELGMYHYKARAYSPTLGRFLQTDPIGYDDQFNLYAYVGNDPVNRVDPDGMQQHMLLFGDHDVSRSATNNSDDPNAGVRAAAEMNLMIAAGVGAAVPVEGLVLKGLAWAGRALGLGSRYTFSGALRLAERMTGGLTRTPGSSGHRSLQGFANGGSSGARRLFNQLTGGRSRDIGRGTQMGSLRSGERVSMSSRVDRETGVTTTTVRVTQTHTPTGSNVPRTTEIKIRFREIEN